MKYHFNYRLEPILNSSEILFLDSFLSSIGRTAPKLFSDNGIARSRSSHRKCSIKKVILKISQILQENTCVGASYNLLLAWSLKPATLIELRLRHSFFPVNFAKLSRKLFYRTSPSDCFCKYQQTECCSMFSFETFAKQSQWNYCLAKFSWLSLKGNQRDFKRP